MNNKKSIGILVEAMILFMLMYFLILSMIMPKFYEVVEYLVGFLLINLGYNSLLKNKKDKLGLMEIIVGILVLVTVVIL